MMIRTTFEQRRSLEQLDADGLGRYQLERLNRLLKTILPYNSFYAEKLSTISPEALGDPAGPIRSLEQFAALPFTFKDELVSSRHPGDLAANLTFPLQQYTRYHQTSGTRGRPLAVLDTADDWAWWIDAWQFIFDAAD